jgi:uncharacterized protein YeaO (DUF488 family)
MPVRTKRIYDPPSPEDGYRLLIMRLWPRGIRKELVTRWEPELGPSRALLNDFHSGVVDWEKYTARYLAEMAEKRGLIAEVKKLATGRTVTLLCSCKEERHCHRTLLACLLTNNH